MCKNNDYILDDRIKIKIRDFLNKQIFNKDKNFANGRLIRNIYEDFIMSQARRVVNIQNVSREELLLIKEEDFILQSIYKI